MANSNEDKKTVHPIVKFLFLFVLPGIVAIVLAIIVLSMAGIDILGWAKEKGSSIPVVSTIVKTEEEKELERKWTKAKETIAKKEDIIEELQQEVEGLEQTVTEMEIEMKKLKNNTEKMEESSVEDTETMDVKQVANSFQKMDKEKAANIIQNLDQPTAILILSNLSGKVRGSILEEMDPKKAAKLMEEMVKLDS